MSAKPCQDASTNNERRKKVGLEQYNMMLFQTADDAWNAQDVETFANCHTEDVVVYVPAAPAQYGMAAHREFALKSFRAFPDQRVQNRPYKAFFAGGDWVCSIARFTGTMTGTMVGPRRDRDPSHRQVVRRRLLHRRATGRTGRWSRSTSSTTW
jgi:predicted ester cyclase